MRTSRFVAIAALACWGGDSLAQPVERGVDHVRLLVEDRSGLFDDEPLGTLCIGSSANGWDPRGTWSMGHFGPAGDDPGGWMFEIPRAVAEDPGFEFKFTRGGWDTVEVGPTGADLANRTLPEVSWEGTSTDFPPEVTLVVHGFADQRGTRFEAPDRPSTVTGDLEVFTVRSEALGNERSIRVWLPPGYRDASNADRRYPVLYLNDGQNVFDAATSFAGEWGADEAATALIGSGEIPPIVIVGIDNAGDDRAVEYNPSGMEVRGAVARGDRYLSFVVDELMPMVEQRYRVREGAEHAAIGGSSFGGNITLLAAMRRPEAFSRYLVESPAAWVGDGAFMERIEAFDGWDGRFFVAMGDLEYGETEKDAALIAIAGRIHTAIARRVGVERARLVVGTGHRHHESAWSERLPDALRFLYSDE
jgi:predicted alpha/beta superfamily hydrolase